MSPFYFLCSSPQFVARSLSMGSRQPNAQTHASGKSGKCGGRWLKNVLQLCPNTSLGAPWAPLSKMPISVLCNVWKHLLPKAETYLVIFRIVTTILSPYTSMPHEVSNLASSCCAFLANRCRQEAKTHPHLLVKLISVRVDPRKYCLRPSC